MHVWGCPVYVLDPKLQDGQKLPKWDPRVQRGQFLGFSNEHSSTVGLILNHRTGTISPQFHCVYDDYFTTVPNAGSTGLFDPALFDADSWTRLLESGCERTLDDDEALLPPSLDAEWMDSPAPIVEQQQGPRTPHLGNDVQFPRELDTVDVIAPADSPPTIPATPNRREDSHNSKKPS